MSTVVSSIETPRGLAGANVAPVITHWPAGHTIGRQYRHGVVDLHRQTLVSVHRIEACAYRAAYVTNRDERGRAKLTVSVNLDDAPTLGVRSITDGRTVREYFGR